MKMVERRQDLVWDLPPWQRNHRDYTKAFLARRNTARGLPGWDLKRFLQPVKPKPLLLPIREVVRPKEFILSLTFPAMDGSPPEVNYDWAAVDGWEGTDPWDNLPCTIRRVLDRREL